MSALVPFQRKYVAKKAFFSFLGNTFRIFDPAGQEQFYVKQKAFRLKEELNVFKDSSQADKRLTIKARSITDFSGGYDIHDPTTGEVVGGAMRHGFKSLFQDEWSLLDAEGNVVGKCIERGGLMILIRKWFPIIPQKYEVQWKGDVVGKIEQQLNPFILAYDVHFHEGNDFDPRHGVGLVVLLLAIEGSRDG